ncbi:MAG TPA: SpoIID/LytB domain-containing protein [Jatrophihabitans sp.]|nr:SpoIID/LytB domain-containing protein [Jatrophihabitans sp.]
MRSKAVRSKAVSSKVARLKAVLVTGAVTAASLVGMVGAAAPAHAWASGTVDFTGHGNGHGRGMGQWGAYGYAVDYGWSYTQILNHYYGGTAVQAVGLAAMTVDLSELDGNGSVWVTSGSAFTAGGLSIPAHGSARITLANGALTVQANTAGCGNPLGGPHATGSGLFQSSVAAPSSVGQMLTVCDSGRAYRGTLTLVNGGGASRVVNTLSMDDYLRGVVPRESPASWGDAAGGKGMNALQAQAIAARSYAAVSNRYSWAKICDSQNCQVYGGAGLNGALIEDSRSNTAVTSTSAKVLVKGGAVVSAEYSASTGGWTAGGTFPAVQDLGDIEAPDHDWTDSVPVGDVQDAFGVGTLQSISVTRNGLGSDGGRVLSATVTGTGGSTTVSGAQFASAVGLKSDWFTVHNPVVPTMYLTNSLSHPAIDVAQAFGQPGDLPLACDFNGDGTDTIGVYRAPYFYLRDSFAGGSPYRTVILGRPGDLPVCGDWDGDGTATVGVYDPTNAEFYLLNTNNRTSSTPVITLLLGGRNFVPVAGDWDGDHHDTPGVFDPATAKFYLINSLAPTAARTMVRFGQPGNQPVAGDWNGDGKDTIGVFQAGRFATTDLLTDHYTASEIVYTSYGHPGDKPVAGDWNGDHRDGVGVGRSY